MKNKDDFIDDGHTIADMSNVGPKVYRNKFNSENSEPIKGKNLLALIGGTLTASLLIGLVYLIGIGLVILLMYMAFKRL